MEMNLQSLPVLFVRGTHYECGYQIGHTLKSWFQQYAAKHANLTHYFLPFNLTDKGRRLYDQYFKNVNKHYPQYIDELKGMSAGAEVDFFKLFWLNIEPEILGHMYLGADAACGSTDIIINRPNNTFLAHVEEAMPDMLKSCYLLDAHIIPDAANTKYSYWREKFTAFCYPCRLPGGAFAFNHNGLVHAVNPVGVSEPCETGTPACFINRALLPARNTQEVCDVLLCSDHGIASGTSVSVTQTGQDLDDVLIWNIECGRPYGRWAARGSDLSSVVVGMKKAPHVDVVNNLFHGNIFERLEGTDTESFGRGQRQLQAWRKHCPTDGNDLQQLLRDYKPSGHPAGRMTTAAVFDLYECTLSVYRQSPKYTKPLISLKVPWPKEQQRQQQIVNIDMAVSERKISCDLKNKPMHMLMHV